MCLLCQKDKQTKKTYKTTFDAILYPYLVSGDLVSGDGDTWNVGSGGLPRIWWIWSIFTKENPLYTSKSYFSGRNLTKILWCIIPINVGISRVRCIFFSNEAWNFGYTMMGYKCTKIVVALLNEILLISIISPSEDAPGQIGHCQGIQLPILTRGCHVPSAQFVVLVSVPSHIEGNFVISRRGPFGRPLDMAPKKPATRISRTGNVQPQNTWLFAYSLA